MRLHGCPCGFMSDPNNECSCTPPQIQKYMARVSGPLLDRIDIDIEVPAVKFKELAGTNTGKKFETIGERVKRARRVQLQGSRTKDISSATPEWSRKRSGNIVKSMLEVGSCSSWRSRDLGFRQGLHQKLSQ